MRALAMDPHGLALLDFLNGETEAQALIHNIQGPLCGWLHVDPETMAERAERAGWRYEIVHQDRNGDYLARLARSKSGVENQDESL